MIAVGVARPKLQGQAMANTVIAYVKDIRMIISQSLVSELDLLIPMTNHMKKVTSVRLITKGTKYPANLSAR